MVGPEHLPTEFVEDVRRYKFRGSSGKVNLALDALPNFTAMPGPGAHLRGAISISPSIEYMERAYDEAKYGRYSRRPYIDIVIPSLTDPSVAPPGKHVMSCFVQYAPYHLREGSWDDHREAFGDTVVNTIAQYAPNIKDIILHRQVVTPARSRARVGPDRRQHLPGRAHARAAVLPAPRARMGALRDADQGPVHVRLSDASRRRDHGGAGRNAARGSWRGEVRIQESEVRRQNQSRQSTVNGSRSRTQ